MSNDINDLATKVDNAVVDFLRAYCETGPWSCSAIDPDKKEIATKTFDPDEIEDLRSWIGYFDGRRNLYFSTNRVKGKPAKKADKNQIASVDYLHVDIDPIPGRPIEEEQARILAMFSEKGLLDRDLPAPTFLIFSGGGYQAFWRLDIPIPVGDYPDSIARAERYNKQLELLFGGDSCHNIDRIMRLPGTWNLPNEKKRAAGRGRVKSELVIDNRDLSYPIENFQQAAPSKTASATEQQHFTAAPVEDLWAALTPYNVSIPCYFWIATGLDEDGSDVRGGDKSDTVWAVVCELAEKKVPAAIVKGILLDDAWAVSEHVLKQGDPDDYADRQISRSRDPAHNSRITKAMAPATRFVRAAPIPYDLPPRPWIVKKLLLRGEMTLLSGAGGSGKSAWALNLANMLGHGEAFGHFEAPSKPLNVVFITSEDGLKENQMRLWAWEVATGRKATENLWLLGCNKDVALLTVPRGADRGAEPAETDLAKDLEAFIAAEKIDVVILDPFVETYRGLEENDNNQMRDVMVFIRDLTIKTNIATMILHHDRKGSAEGSVAEGSRGASAIINAARFHYALRSMTEAEAKKFQIDNPGPYVRFAFGKSNRVARQDDAWYKFCSVELPNGEELGHIELATLSKIVVDEGSVLAMIRDGRDGSGTLPFLVSNRGKNPSPMDAFAVNLGLVPDKPTAVRLFAKLEREGRIEKFEWRNPEGRKDQTAWRVISAE